jgi:hypothetical protein
MKTTAVTCLIWGLTVSAGLPAPPEAPINPNREFKPELAKSTYAPTKKRDPFGWSGGAVATTSTGQVTRTFTASVNFPFRLEGIQYDPISPSAIINDRLVFLRKPVTLVAGSAAIEVKAVEITANRVVLEVGDQRVELRLAPERRKP